MEYIYLHVYPFEHAASLEILLCQKYSVLSPSSLI